MISKLLQKLSIFFLIIGLLGCKTPGKFIQNKTVGIKIMSFNIHHGNPPGDEKKIDLDAIVRTIKDADASIIALQEVDINTLRSGKVNQAEILAKALNMEVFFSRAIDFEGGEYGLAILSKYKFKETKFYKLSSAADAKAEPRILQTVVVNFPGQQRFVFANTHLDVLNTGNRILQAKEIAAIAEKEKLSFILAGDWNAPLKSETLLVLDKVFKLTCKVCPITCPEDGTAIDFIAYTKKSPFKTKTYKVFSDNNSSDHYPVFAEIIYPH